jgi:polyhydroxyalkanoate synthase
VLAASPALGQANVRKLKTELGIASTPCRVVHSERSFSLLHFPPAPPAGRAPEQDPAGAGPPPVLLVPSLINRWYVLDLLPGHSLVAALAAAGLPVYLLAWEGAHDGQAGLDLQHAVEVLLQRAVLRTLRHHGRGARVTLLGQCLGGTLALAHAALHPEQVDRLVTLTTPVDFSAEGLLTRWARAGSLDVDRIAAVFPGRVPDALVYGAFPLLDPRALVTRHRLLLENLQHEEFRRVYQAIDVWTTDHLPVAGGVLASIVNDLYRGNALWEGRWRFSTGEVGLARVTCPLLNVVALSDEIVPPASARPLLERVGSTVKQELASPLGHITLVAGHPLRFQTWKAMADFCARTF